MKVWEVWTEGYSATGDQSGASFRGKYEAETFQDACEMWHKEQLTLGFTGIDSDNPKRNTVWGCQFYDNETDARKYFG